MGKGHREAFSVTFVALPDEFRRVHRSELESVSIQAHWLEKAALLTRQHPPTAIVLNLDDKNAADPTTWEFLRHRFPRCELVAISSRDSAQLAMHCMREGFSDFLTQPVTSDELALSLLRCRQRQQSVENKVFADGDLSRALAQVGGCSSLTTLRMHTSAALRLALGASRAHWSPARTARKAPKDGLLFRCQKPAHGSFVAEGVPKNLSQRRRNQALAVVAHAELAILNLKRVDKLKRQTFIDDLTGLYNSRYLRFALEAASVHFHQRKEPFGLLFIDVDRFKSVNDQHGHLVGSDFLTALGRIIKNAVRTHDSVFRYGGDEFVILLRNAGVVRATEVAERLRRQIEHRQFVIRGVRLRTSVSVGLAVYPEHSNSLDTLISLADEAMYAAKRSRNQVKVATGKPARPARTRRPEPTL